MVTLREANLDRFSALVDAAALRADDPKVLFDFVLAIAGLWDRLELRDPFVDAQLGDAEARERLVRAAREPASAAAPEDERLAFYALRTLAAVQRFVEGSRRQPAGRMTRAGR
jgi:hypothetical protein